MRKEWKRNSIGRGKTRGRSAVVREYERRRMDGGVLKEKRRMRVRGREVRAVEARTGWSKRVWVRQG